jgi:peptidoglycan/xylan/chitin deacetylase (PgdA/CDA1 family)
VEVKVRPEPACPDEPRDPQSLKKVTLTFDNGPDPDGTTTAVLDLLALHGVKATFFLTGQQLRLPGASALARRTHMEGHWIGNHTMSHSVPFGVSDDRMLPLKEIGEMQELIGSISHPDRLFRPFGNGGALDDRLLSKDAIGYLVEGRYSCVLWNSVPRDWEADAAWVDRCLEDVQMHAWTLVVMHDLPTGGMRYLATLLARLKGLGAEIVQGFPSDCVPIVRGQIVSDLSRFSKK